MARMNCIAQRFVLRQAANAIETEKYDLGLPLFVEEIIELNRA